MKRIFKRWTEKLLFKDLPPPYRENDYVTDNNQALARDPDSVTDPTREVIDLLVNCNITHADGCATEVEYAEIPDMGIWHSTPLAQRHKSKISLTWVLKENLESQEKKREKRRSKSGFEVNKCHRQFSDELKTRTVPKERVAGRNEFYRNVRLRSACDVSYGYTCSDDTSLFAEEQSKKKHKHRHKRKKKRHNGKFGYDIKDLDSFLAQATLDHPGNIPVVIAYPTTLYQTQKEGQSELTLPLGTVVNAVFKNQQWLYVQTPHSEEGYVLYNTCLPLGILPNRTSTQKKTPCWESSIDIYPKPSGNFTDNEKEQYRSRTRSESHQRDKKRLKNSCAEREFDTLYLRTKSVCSSLDKVSLKDYKSKAKRHTLLIVNNDYKGSALNKTLSVKQGEVVVLVEGMRQDDVNAEWFYVKKRDGSTGFIPAEVAGHGYI